MPGVMVLVPIQGLFEAHLHVTDLQRSLAFYAEVLGLPPRPFYPLTGKSLPDCTPCTSACVRSRSGGRARSAGERTGSICPAAESSSSLPQSFSALYALSILAGATGA